MTPFRTILSLGLIALAPVAAAQPSAGQARAPGAALKVSTPTPAVPPAAQMGKFKSSVKLSDALIARLKAAGLDAGDPQLPEKLKQRNASIRHAFLSRPASLTTQPSASPGGGKAAALPAGLSKSRSVVPQGPSTLEIQSFSVSAWDVSGQLKVKAPAFYSPGQVSYRLVEPTCGLDVSGTLEGSGWFCCGYDDQHVEWMGVKAYPSKPFIFGGKARDVTMTLSASGLPAVTKVFPGVWGRGQGVTIKMVIDAAPPHLPANDFGVGAANAKFGGSGARSSTGEPWAPTSGEDTIGLGVNLGGGYSVTSTKITAVHSQLDPPNYSAPENSYRYARIKTPPAGGRLQTVVEWMYGPAESLTYTIEWTLGGPMGQRPLSTMPSAGPCDVN